jgi:hypothetical protein
MMVSPGSSKEKIEILKKRLNGIPSSFISLIEKFNFNGVCINGFEIAPCYSPHQDLVENILESYEDPFFPKEFMEKHNMFQIGSYSTHLLCLTKGTIQFREGEILFVEEGYDIYNPQNSQIQRLAKDFEQFLIVAGNLNQIHREINDDNSNWEEKKAEFIERLKLLEVNEEYYPAWLSVF